MKIYDNWKKMSIYILVAGIVALVSGAIMFFGMNTDSVFYFSYLLNSLIITICSIVFSIKNGFKWWYITTMLFVQTIIMVIYFLPTQVDMIPVIFVSYLSASLVSSAIGAIVGKIRKNNEE